MPKLQEEKSMISKEKQFKKQLEILISDVSL